MIGFFIDADAYHLVEKPNMKGTPERNLLMAVLERAILDFVGNDQKEVLTAEKWIFGDIEEAATHCYELTEFSFPWLCHELDLKMEDIADKIKNMPKRGNRRVAPWYFSKAS